MITRRFLVVLVQLQIGGLCDYDLECNHIDNLTQCVDHKCECQQDFLVSKTNSCIAGSFLLLCDFCDYLVVITRSW